jgi:hypothetical protein
MYIKYTLNQLQTNRAQVLLKILPSTNLLMNILFTHLI